MTSRDNVVTQEGEATFNNFLITEYSNTAEAHFKSIETISTFFRYYLLILGIPISASAIFLQRSNDTQKVLEFVSEYKIPISVVIISIAFIGFGVFCYVTSLRMDTILYARAVNGIRKLFYDQWNKDLNIKLRVRVLPQSPQLPPYFEFGFFIPVVSVFSIMNTIYIFCALYILSINNPWFMIILIGALVVHFATYWRYSEWRTNSYLRSNIVGIDIDGVLNKHRDHFCQILKKHTGKELKPEQIEVMPVHEHPKLQISREDERLVFNDPEYWYKMPALEDAAENIRKIRNIFKLKIFLFTLRPWPDDPDRKKLDELIKAFSKKVACCSHLFNRNPLKQITRMWLKNNNFVYNRLYFEKGNDYSTDPRGEFNNRFNKARENKIRYFVEDDLEKAIKLSFICDIVFLMSHPYNEPDGGLNVKIKELSLVNLPSNVIRVNNWTEIYQQIRRLS